MACFAKLPCEHFVPTQNLIIDALSRNGFEFTFKRSGTNVPLVKKVTGIFFRSPTDTQMQNNNVNKPCAEQIRGGSWGPPNVGLANLATPLEPLNLERFFTLTDQF